MTATGTTGPRAVLAGIGETDHAAVQRSSQRGDGSFDLYREAAGVLDQALADAGRQRSDVDALIVGPFLGEARSAEVFGIDATWTGVRDACTAIVEAQMLITSGLARCVALVHSSDQRSAAASYGGPDAMAQHEHLAYRYYAPWGLTSQGALYALAARRFMAETKLTEAQLGAVAVEARRFAAVNPRAVNRRPLSLDDYLAEPYLADPLRRSDYCLVNDGAVAIVVVAEPDADTGAGPADRPTVVLRGYGSVGAFRGASSLRNKLAFYAPATERVAADTYRRAGLGPQDLDCLQLYDAFSIHVPILLTAFGVVAGSEVGEWLAAGHHGPGGEVPVNTAGGHLAESYLHGWTHAIETVHQLRGTAGERQTPDCEHVLLATLGAGRVKGLIVSREAA